MNKKVISLGLIALGAVAILGSTSAYAANKIGTVTGKDGDIKDKVQISAEITAENGSHVTIKDTETGDEYQTSVGPSWYSGTYNVGDKVTIEGVTTAGDNDNNHNFQVTKINDTTLRDSFEGKPAWAGKGGNGQGQNKGQGNADHGQNNGGNFSDANGDGKCDNLE
ncbi:MAG: hypothetical protein WCG48_03485 [Candidatus Berkelbacteria bacterium]